MPPAHMQFTAACWLSAAAFALILAPDYCYPRGFLREDAAPVDLRKDPYFKTKAMQRMFFSAFFSMLRFPLAHKAHLGSRIKKMISSDPDVGRISDLAVVILRGKRFVV
eukprot:412693-Amorphochlora_amoeboformis.AAC.1